jgi:hypothetical protein
MREAMNEKIGTARERVEVWAMGVTGENNVDADEAEKMMGERMFFAAEDLAWV